MIIRATYRVATSVHATVERESLFEIDDGLSGLAATKLSDGEVITRIERWAARKGLEVSRIEFERVDRI